MSTTGSAELTRPSSSPLATFALGVGSIGLTVKLVAMSDGLFVVWVVVLGGDVIVLWGNVVEAAGEVVVVLACVVVRRGRRVRTREGEDQHEKKQGTRPHQQMSPSKRESWFGHGPRRIGVLVDNCYSRISSVGPVLLEQVSNCEVLQFGLE
jgi:hypothetical protein